MSSLFSIGAMDQLADALETAGYTRDDVTKLKQFGNLKGIKDVLFGKAEIQYPEHLINCEGAPFIPPGWSVAEHKRQGLWKWDPDIILHLSKKQKKGYISGNELRKELEKMLALNANVLDYLLVFPSLIPEEWKGKNVFFWGTIYRSSGSLCVRYLEWTGPGWTWCFKWVTGAFNDNDPAGVAS